LAVPLAVLLLLGGCGVRAGTHAGTHGPAAAPSGVTAPATTTPVNNGRSQGVLDDAVKADDEPGCSAAVGVEGNVVWTGARGVADLATHTKITADTVFDIASVSKQFTATTVLLLAQDGKLSVNDPLSRHIPGLPKWAATVTLAQLIHQTSGIPDYIEMLENQGYKLTDRTTEDQALQAVAGVRKLEFKPGSKYEYSNSNYLLLGDIVRRVSGQPLPQFLRARIFEPLGLSMVLDPVGEIPGKAVSYEKDKSEIPSEYRISFSPWEQIGDGGIQTSPSELVRWADNYRTGKVGGQPLLDAQLAGAVKTAPNGNDRYGAGIILLADGQLDHDGQWEGFVTAFRVSKDRRTSLAITCNTDGQDPESIADALANVWM
jgi:CubicO group peptidase (beta-lactamase class C family)